MLFPYRNISPAFICVWVEVIGCFCSMWREKKGGYVGERGRQGHLDGMFSGPCRLFLEATAALKATAAPCHRSEHIAALRIGQLIWSQPHPRQWRGKLMVTPFLDLYTLKSYVKVNDLWSLWDGGPKVYHAIWYLVSKPALFPTADLGIMTQQFRGPRFHLKCRQAIFPLVCLPVFICSSWII